MSRSTTYLARFSAERLRQLRASLDRSGADTHARGTLGPNLRGLDDARALRSTMAKVAAQVLSDHGMSVTTNLTTSASAPSISVTPSATSAISAIRDDGASVTIVLDATESGDVTLAIDADHPATTRSVDSAGIPDHLCPEADALGLAVAEDLAVRLGATIEHKPPPGSMTSSRARKQVARRQAGGAR